MSAACRLLREKLEVHLQASIQESDVGTGARPSTRILLADDDVDTREQLRLVLLSGGYQVDIPVDFDEVGCLAR
jgi:hypothetical protein